MKTRSEIVASAVANLLPEEVEQLNSIKRITSVAKLFHDPIPNNRYFLLVSASDDRDAALDRMADDLRHLNFVNKLCSEYAYRWCKSRRSSADSEIESTMREIAHSWSASSERNQHYMGPSLIQAFCTGYRLVNDGEAVIFPDECRSRLLEFPLRAKDALKLYLRVQPSAIDATLANLSGLLRETHSQIISRIEIEKIRSNSEKLQVILEFNSSGYEEPYKLLSSFLGAARNLTHYSYQDTFTRPILSVAGLAQGLRGYKVFAQELGIVQQEFDQEYGFAYRLGAAGAYARKMEQMMVPMRAIATAGA